MVRAVTLLEDKAPDVVADAIKKYGLDPDKPYSLYV